MKKYLLFYRFGGGEFYNMEASSVEEVMKSLRLQWDLEAEDWETKRQYTKKAWSFPNMKDLKYYLDIEDGAYWFYEFPSDGFSGTYVVVTVKDVKEIHPGDLLPGQDAAVVLSIMPEDITNAGYDASKIDLKEFAYELGDYMVETGIWEMVGELCENKGLAKIGTR